MRSEPIEQRLARIESRIVQIMLHLGIDPYRRMYDGFEANKHGAPSELDSPGSRKKPK